MAMTFPTNPQVGDEFTSASRVWVWDGTVWASVQPASTGGSSIEDTLMLMGG